MATQHNDIDFDSLNVAIRSFTNVNDLIFPLRVHIKDIYNTEVDVIDYKVDFISNKDDEYIYSIDHTDSPFKREIELQATRNNLKYIYRFLDFGLVDEYGRSLFSYIGVDDEESFIQFMTSNEFISREDIIRIGYEVNFLVAKVKGIFMERALIALDWDRAFPAIKLKKESKVPESYKEMMVYPRTMIGLQTVSEYPMDIWFEENVGKAYSQWSWREKEFKKLYVTMKVRIENFKELVKAKEIENSMEDNNKSGGGRRR